MSTQAGDISTCTTRAMQSDEDFWKVRHLLVETLPITPTGFNWDVRRWDGRRFYDANPAGDPNWLDRGQLWERADGRLVGAAHPAGRSEIALQVHPNYRHLEEEMIAWGEAHLSGPVKDGPGQQVHVFTYDDDMFRLEMLAGRGYEATPHKGVIRRMPLADATLPTPNFAEGYTLRTTNPEDRADGQRIADLLNAAFGRDFHNAEEYQNFTRLAPSFRADLDLVAEAPDRTFAAYVGIPYEEVNRYGIYEPVCTHPDHRQKGLAQALMIEGLHRLQAMGALDATVETGDMIPANKLYDSIGFTEVRQGTYWRKIL